MTKIEFNLERQSWLDEINKTLELIQYVEGLNAQLQNDRRQLMAAYVDWKKNNQPDLTHPKP